MHQIAENIKDSWILRVVVIYAVALWVLTTVGIWEVAWMYGIYLKPRHIATVDTMNGLLSFDSKDRFLGREPYVYRQFEYPEMLDTVETLKKSVTCHRKTAVA